VEESDTLFATVSFLSFPSGGACLDFDKELSCITSINTTTDTASMLLPAARQSCTARTSTSALSAVKAGKQRW